MRFGFVILIASVCLVSVVLALASPSRFGASGAFPRSFGCGFLILAGLLLAGRGAMVPGILLAGVGGFLMFRVMSRQRRRPARRFRPRYDGAGASLPRPARPPPPPPVAPTGGRMTEEEAYAVLGLSPGASESDIRRVHRELMQKIHPDHGGTTYFAAKLNLARDTLLKKPAG